MARRALQLPPPTIGVARALLQKARDELAREENRQAAEKGWLALVTASRAMLRSAGENWASSRNVADRLSEIESSAQSVTSALRVMAGSLHGTCFYGGAIEEEYCGRQAIEANFKIVERAIGDAAVYCRKRPVKLRSGKRWR